jgi:hypothetical protein
MESLTAKSADFANRTKMMKALTYGDALRLDLVRKWTIQVFLGREPVCTILLTRDDDEVTVEMDHWASAK